MMLRPTATSDWELCGNIAENKDVCIRLTLSQILTIGEQCNRIVYSKFAGMRPMEASNEKAKANAGRSGEDRDREPDTR